MRVFIDTNILVSAMLSPKGIASAAYREAVALPGHAVISDLVVCELHSVFKRKFPSKAGALEDFIALALLSINLVPTPKEPVPEEETVRDPADRPILRAALAAGADILLTGDKDFLEAPILSLRVMMPREFLEVTPG